MTTRSHSLPAYSRITFALCTCLSLLGFVSPKSAFAQTNTAPQVVATPVAFASEAPGLTHSVPITYRDAQGNGTLAGCWFGVNTVSSWGYAVWAVYDAQTNLISLRNTDGSAWLPTAAPGSSTVLSNSMGSINCAQTTVVRSGTDLTINWNVTSAQPLAGPNHVFAYCDDTGGLNSGPTGTNGTFTDIGTWTVANLAPTVTIPSPLISLSTPTGQAQTVTTTINDGNTATNARYVYFQINDVDNSANSFLLVYDAYTNQVMLRSDNGQSWSSGVALGSSATLTNSSGTLDCSQSTVTRTGNALQINWRVTMKSGALGPNNIYVFADDRGGLGAGNPGPLGTWNVALAAPTGLTATPHSSEVLLSWSAVPGATGYKVYRSTTSNTYSSTPLTTLGAATSYTDSTPADGTTYHYVVRALVGSTESANSNQVSALPTNWASTTLTGQAGNGEISLGWTPAEGATSYQIYQNSGSGPALIATVNPAATTTSAGTHYTKTGLTNNTSYTYFVVVGYGGTMSTHPSNSLTLTPISNSLGGYYNGVDNVTWNWYETFPDPIVTGSGTAYIGLPGAGPEALGVTRDAKALGIGSANVNDVNHTAIKGYTEKNVVWHWVTSNPILYPAPSCEPSYTFTHLMTSDISLSGDSSARCSFYITNNFGDVDYNNDVYNSCNKYGGFVHDGIRAQANSQGDFTTLQSMTMRHYFAASSSNSSSSASVRVHTFANFGMTLLNFQQP